MRLNAACPNRKRKKVNCMRLRIFCGTVILLISLACAGFAADAPKVTLDAKDTPFNDAMADIAKQAGVQIVCESDFKKTVTGHFDSMDLEKLVDTLTKVNSL